MAAETSAVLLMAYGSPATLEDVEGYYTHIRGGRTPTPEQVEGLRARYRAIGGSSPLRRITQAQAEALAARVGLPVYVGMKHWHPFIAETVDQMRADGIARAVAIALAPHYSRMSIGGYITAVAEAAARAGGPQMAYVESWHLHPLFLDALADRVREARRSLGDPEAPPVVFTAHSLPERILEWGDPYVAQLHETAGAVARAAEVRRWSVAFQSASATGEPWLGPDILDVLRELHAGGAREVVVCPAGFVADHLEVLYDIDVEARQLAESFGIRLVRTGSLNADPSFIETLAAIAQKHLNPLAERC
ncbi:MAG: ferrochelatase [Armatimonadetes bacterium]|nr:ferrochelatase [Armatimonadota bacterium]